jgi:hypothetical protein
MNDRDKTVVFSRTLGDAEWQNTRIAERDPASEA